MNTGTRMNWTYWLSRLLAMALIAGTLAGCATGRDPRDPLEGFNRTMFEFNDAVDRNAIKPVAEVYSDYVPSFLQTAVYNFFGNLGDVWTMVNNLLQGKGADASTDLMRVAVNSVFGLAGILDIASEAGMPKHKQDFGATLGVWGVGSGPYVVLPFLGPSTLRDTAALPVDSRGDFWRRVYPVPTRNTGFGLRIIDLRAGLLGASGMIEDAALDRYEFVRDAYLQRRANKINDGEPQKRQKDQQSVAPDAAEQFASALGSMEPKETDSIQFSLIPRQPLPGMRLPPEQGIQLVSLNSPS